MKPDKQKTIIIDTCTIRETMLVIDKTPLGIALIVNSQNKLTGVVTDGDIRRALASDADIDSPVASIMNSSPVTISTKESNHRVLRLFNEKIRQIPVLDEQGHVLDILLYDDFAQKIFDHKKSVVVRSKAPLRISFAGGGTDVGAFLKANSGAVLSTTINKYSHATLIKRDDGKIIINSVDYGQRIELSSIQDIVYDGQLDLIKATIKLLHPDFGFDLYIRSDVPPKTGLGGSSSAAAAVAGILNYFREEKLDEYQLAELAFQAERVELGIGGGWQDQYATVFGGFNFMEFQDSDVFIHPLRMKPDLLNELEESMLLFFVGNARKHEGRPNRPSEAKVDEALNTMRELALKMRNHLLKGDLNQFGEMLHEGWLLKKRVEADAANPHIDALYELGIKNGALGGKMLGAGGGGYMLFFCPPLMRHSVSRALTEAGAISTNLGFDDDGLQTWVVKGPHSTGGLT